MNLETLRQFSAQQWEALCGYLQPAGKKEGCHWLAGSINGERGRSFDVNLRTGIFGDWASDDKKQRGPINYWMAVTGVDFKTAVQGLAAWLGGQADIPQPRHQRSAPNERDKMILFPSGLSLPTEQDLQLLSQSRAIAVDALRIAAERGFIYSFDDKLNGRCWLYTDQRLRCGLRRRLDNMPFRLSNGSQCKVTCCPGSDMRTPIGYQEAEGFPSLGIVEGAPDALALLAHAWASSVETHISPICMPSAGASFTDSSLGYLQNKRARIFIDNDDDGRKAANRWAAHLQRANVAVDGFIFTGLFTTDGRPVKDLNDLLKVDYDSWEQFRSQVEAVMNFAF
ncbi:MAG TPA: toprim domain-containing protein [Terriglobales bacterium]|nr:toprim domain-containing protein [Terriglobales bacterium]